MSGGQIYAKPANDRSITSPPSYDTAPLTIPVLQPGEEVILEFPDIRQSDELRQRRRSASHVSDRAHRDEHHGARRTFVSA